MCSAVWTSWHDKLQLWAIQRGRLMNSDQMVFGNLAQQPWGFLISPQMLLRVAARLPADLWWRSRGTGLGGLWAAPQSRRRFIDFSFWRWLLIKHATEYQSSAIHTLSLKDATLFPPHRFKQDIILCHLTFFWFFLSRKANPVRARRCHHDAL